MHTDKTNEYNPEASSFIMSVSPDYMEEYESQYSNEEVLDDNFLPAESTKEPKVNFVSSFGN